jgi:hypothetical protein
MCDASKAQSPEARTAYLVGRRCPKHRTSPEDANKAMIGCIEAYPVGVGVCVSREG